MNSLVGWHVMIIVGVLVVSALVVAGVIALGIRLARRRTPDGRG